MEMTTFGLSISDWSSCITMEMTTFGLPIIRISNCRFVTWRLHTEGVRRVSATVLNTFDHYNKLSTSL
jgi:hypothetical protein